MSEQRHTTARVVATGVAAAALLVSAPVSAADDPPGTIRVTPVADGTVRDRVTVLTGSLRDVVIAVEHRRDGTDQSGSVLASPARLMALRPGNPPDVLGELPAPSQYDAGRYSSVRSVLSTSGGFEEGGTNQRVNWWRLESGTSGSVLLGAGRSYLTGASGGFLVREGDHVQLQTTDGTITDLGTPFPGVSAFAGTAGDDGAVLVPSADGTLDGVSLRFGEPGFTPLPGTAGLDCRAVVAEFAACLGVGPNRAVQVPVDGTRPVKVVETGTRVDAVAVAGVTGSQLLWQGGPQETLRSADYDASAVQVSPTRYGLGLHVAFDGVVLAGAGLQRLFTTFSATEPPTFLFGTGPGPVAATSVSVSPGRLIQVDDRQVGATTASSALETRLSTSSAVLRVGSTSVVRRGTYPLLAEASGTTTVVASPDFGRTGNRVLRTPRGSVTLRGTLADRSPTHLSGNRYVVLRRTTAGTRAYVYDATTGRTTLVQSGFGHGAGPPAISGDQLAFVRRDGSVWRKNLVTGVSVQLSAPRPYDHAEVFASGDLVGWNLSLGDDEHRTGISAYRDARTMAPATTVDATILQLTSSGIVTTAGGYSLLARDGRTVPLFTTLTGEFPRVEGRTQAWVDGDGVVKVAPVDVAPGPPRFLGDPLAPARLRTPGRPGWRSFAPYDAPLTSCSVTISDPTRVVRRLTCGASRMRVGVAAFSWDGTVAGRPARPGAYTYRIVARGDGGAARNAAGAALPVRRSIRVG